MPCRICLRRVVRDCEFRGVRLKRNDRVILPNTVANRDPAVFDKPQEIDLGRKVNNHVTFGVGPHRCIGLTPGQTGDYDLVAGMVKAYSGLSTCAGHGALTAFGGAVMGFESLKLVW